jgi:hypothetical protein
MSLSAAAIRFRPLLDFIADHEGTANQPGGGYNTSLGYGKFTGGEKILVAMTLDEINALQLKMLKHPKNHFNSSALGRYQIVRKTLLGLRKNLGLSGSQKYSSELQDELGATLIQGRGRDPDGLRAEWASLVNATDDEILEAYDTIGKERELDLLADHLEERLELMDDSFTQVTYKIQPAKSDKLEEELNRLAADGWQLKQILPGSRDGLILVMEGDDPEGDDDVRLMIADLLNKPEDLVDDINSARIADFDEAEFIKFFEKMNLKYFKYQEFLVLGGQHFSGPCKGKNTFPPEKLWPNIVSTAKVLDKLRDELKAPINTTSVYRSPPYNACIDGAGASMHMKFNAVDFKCSDGKGSVHWAKTLKAMRDAGEFKGGIGVYQTFVHIDTRGKNANFGPWKNKVF